MAQRLKVFVTSDGLTDYVVATTSRPKALAAWGVRQDLFKEGAARESDDAALAAEARRSPGEVLRRPAGSRAALAKTRAAPKPAKPRGPSKAALRRVAALEARMNALEAEEARLAARLAEQVAALEAKADMRRAEIMARREALAAELRKARRAVET
jgi:hypothetical protein